jgi:hypothetical protein
MAVVESHQSGKAALSLSGVRPDLGRLPTSLNYFEIYKFQYVDRFKAYPGVSRRHSNVEPK